MKLFLMALGFLMAAAVSAQEIEPKGSFELSQSLAAFDMNAVGVGDKCDGSEGSVNYKEGAIGMDSAGLILSCQSDSWKKAETDLPSGTICGLSYTGCTGGRHESNYTPCMDHNPRTSCPSGYVRKFENEGNGCGITYLYRCIKE